MKSRHVTTPAKTLLALELNSIKLELKELFQTQSLMKESLENENDQELIAATQSLIHLNKLTINFFNEKKSKIHKTLKNWDLRNHNFQVVEPSVKNKKNTTEDILNSISITINLKRKQYNELAELQRKLKKDIKPVKHLFHSELFKHIESNKLELNKMSLNLKILKSKYSEFHDKWYTEQQK